MNRKLVALGLAVALLVLSTNVLRAQTFSLDPGSGLPNTIFGPGLAALYPPGPPAVDVDCFSFFSPMFPPDGVVFSVAPGTVGLPGSGVAAQFAIAPGEQIADIYFAALGSGTNVLLFDGDGSTPPGLGLPEPGLANIDGVDAFDLSAGPPPPPLTPVFFSVSPATTMTMPPAHYVGFSPADVFVAPAFGPGGPYSLPHGAPASIFAPAAALGLIAGLGPPASDDIDGIHVLEDGVMGASIADVVYFSLAPGSPTLGALGATAADVLSVVLTPVPLPFIFAPAGTIGLTPGDNIDALSMHMPGAGVPVELSRFRIE